jgi:hypothetical protein
MLWIGTQVMTTLPVKPLPSNDNGRLLVRLNTKHRPGIPRYGIVQLTNANNTQSVKVLVLGHDDETAIFMPYDIRKALGADTRSDLEFSIQKVRWFGKIYWLLRTPDPAVHIPARLALISVLLGALGVVIALSS